MLLAFFAITFLTVRVGLELLEGPPPPAPQELGEAPSEPEVVTGVAEPEPAPEPAPASAPPPAPAAAPSEPVGLRIDVNDRVRVAVELGGVTWFKGFLCPKGDDRCEQETPLKVPPGDEIAVELSDLAHTQLTYNGRRIEPLGNLVESRRLVFIDDAGR